MKLTPNMDNNKRKSVFKLSINNDLNINADRVFLTLKRTNHTSNRTNRVNTHPTSQGRDEFMGFINQYKELGNSINLKPAIRKQIGRAHV